MDILNRLKSFKSVPQQRATSQEITHWEYKSVTLLTGPYSLPTVYTKAGEVAKRQPKPIQSGDTAYIRLENYDGNAYLYPFPMAGSGYELVNDAIEGVHYNFAQ